MSGRRRARGGHEEGGGVHGGGGLRWLITYADMITLLLGLFIMLYAISSLDLARFQALSEEFQMLFSGKTNAMEGGKGMLKQGAPDSQRPLVVPLIPGKKPEMHDEEVALEHYVERKGLQHQVLIHREERGLVVSLLTDGVFFTLGSATLSPHTREVVRQIAGVLNESHRFIRVEGYTCDLSIHSAMYSSNWELSVARATAVLRFLVACGVNPRRMSAVGYGEFRPMVPNTSEENRRLNRRVDIVLLSDVGARGESEYKQPSVLEGMP